MFITVPVFIIVSLCTKHDPCENIESTYFKALGAELKTTDLIPEKEKATHPGLFGWLGADSKAWKCFWIITIVAFTFHYIGSFLFHIPAIGLCLTWTSLIVGIVLLVLLSVLGGKDIGGMAKSNMKLSHHHKA